MNEIRTTRLNRDQIAQAVGNNPIAIRLIEALSIDVTQTLPIANQQNAEATVIATNLATTATVTANQALAHAQSVSEDVFIGPIISSLQAEIDTLRARIDALELGMKP